VIYRQHPLHLRRTQAVAASFSSEGSGTTSIRRGSRSGLYLGSLSVSASTINAWSGLRVHRVSILAKRSKDQKARDPAGIGRSRLIPTADMGIDMLTRAGSRKLVVLQIGSIDENRIADMLGVDVKEQGGPIAVLSRLVVWLTRAIYVSTTTPPWIWDTHVPQTESGNGRFLA
jgi:cytosine/adenosine deaminase-related metal-dependent hydrolase